MTSNHRLTIPTIPSQTLRACLTALPVLTVLTVPAAAPLAAQRTAKPPLHGRHWMAITGKPLGATAGAMMFTRGGNAVDATAARLMSIEPGKINGSRVSRRRTTSRAALNTCADGLVLLTTYMIERSPVCA